MTLVEVLVALLILSIGMLGIALMFVHSLRSNRSALLRTQAVNLVSDMADRIRANAGGRAAYSLSRYGGAPAERGCAPNAVPGSGNNCSAVELAEDDLARWQRSVRETLPPAPAGIDSADVQYAAGLPDRYRIRVTWQEPSEAQAFSYETEVSAFGAS